MKDLLFFDKMITPKIINLVYWLMLASTLITGISAMFSHYGGGFLAGVFILISGVLGARIFCELLIVLFKINENMQKIADKS